MAYRHATLHHGGNDIDNPILHGQYLTIVLNKQDDEQALKLCVVLVGGSIFYDLTSLCVEDRESVSVDVVAGTHLESGYPAVKNVVRFTLTPHVMSKQTIYVATRPGAMITLDGYNADDITKPLIYPIYDR